MQRKLRLSCWALMTSSFLIKVANADRATFLGGSPLIPIEVSEPLGKIRKLLPEVKGLKEKADGSKRILNQQIIEENGLLEEGGIESLSFEVLTNSIIDNNTVVYIADYNSETSGKKVNGFNYKHGGYSINNTVKAGGKLYVDEASISRDTTIESGGVEFVQNFSTSEYAIIKKGGKQIVESGASTDKVQIYGGEQTIFGENSINGKTVSSSAYDTVIYGQDYDLGTQIVYSGGMAFNTKIMKGGVQSLGGEEDDEFTLSDGAAALGTEVFKNGTQYIFAGGKASEVVLYNNATQEIYDNGYVDSLTINDQAKSWLHAGAILAEDTNINDFGSIYIYAGDDKYTAEVESLILNGENTKLYSIATGTDSKKTHINIKKLSGSGRVVFTVPRSDRYYSQLNIDNLSGNLHFDFNVSFAEQRGDYLSIKKSGEGYHTISVVDSGIEITNFAPKNLKLISDRSGGAHFTLTNAFGEKISTVDAGTYMYSLKYRKNKNHGKIWYLSANYAIDNEENSLVYNSINSSTDNVSTALSTGILTELTIDKGKVVYIADPDFGFYGEVGYDSSHSNKESSINNTVREGGKLYIYNGGFNLYTKIESGGVEIVKKQGLSHDTSVYSDGQQRIEDGGKAEGTKIYGGEQFVFGRMIVQGEIVRSSADGTVIAGQDQALGYQNVYDGGLVFNTQIMEGGIQNLYIEDFDFNKEDYGASAFNTQVFSGGEQNVLLGGEAFGVALSGTAIQKIDLGGYVKDLTISGQAKSWLHHGATLEGSTTVNDSGQIYLYSGASRSRTEVEKIILNGKDAKLYSIASNVDGESSLIENLSGDGSVIFTSTIFNPHYSKLYIDDLSGNLKFRLNFNFAENRGDSLFIKKGAGYHMVSIIDSGIEINNSFSSEHNFIADFDLITDQSGGAHFTLVDFSGEQISAVDVGVYTYDLKHKNDDGGKIWYLSPVNNVSIPSIIPSNMVLPTDESLEPQENVVTSRNFVVGSHINYLNDFNVNEDKLILQNFMLSDGQTVRISDYGEAGVPNRSVNNAVHGAGTIYVEAGGFSQNTTIESGGFEVISEQGVSNRTIVYEGGQQRVEGGGVAVEVEVYGGNQIVFGDSYVNGGIMGSSAYNTTIYGQGETLGQQSVYDDGMVVKTKIMSGGVQNLAKWFADDDDFSLKNGGLAVDTEIFAGGVQRILAGGVADTVVLHARAVQEVHTGGYVKNLTIEGGGNSLVFAGATLGGEVTVHNSGQLHLYTGEDIHQTTAENINLDGDESLLYSVSSEFDDKSAKIQMLNGVGRVIFSSAESNLYYSRLYVDNLSGSIHFDFNVSMAEGKGDYLFIKNGSGYHTVSVIDSGIEIVDPTSINLDLIVDQSGKAHFTLQNFSGAKIGIVDGGTYTYGLKQKQDKNKEEKIWYLSPVFINNFPHKGRFPRHLSANSPVLMSSTVVSPKGESVDSSDLMSSNQRSGRRRQPPISSSVASSANNVVEVSSPRDSHRSLNGNHQSATSSSSPSLDNQIVDDSNHQDDLSPQLMQELLTSDLLTTPSTDAVLSMAVTPELIFNSELQSIRIGKGILDRNKRNSTLWTYAIKNKEQLSTGHTDFKLNQTGLVLGMNALNSLVNGELYIGGFGSYNRAHIAHSRGGTSDITSYSIGTYATYFNHSGWYLDGVLKYNHYQNNLQAVSTNGLSIQGDYDRWAIGTSFEVGYRCKVSQSSWMQPYAQLSWLQVKGKEVKLSNGMMGDISPSTSLRSEVGLSLGYEFGSGMDTPSLAYVTAAWLRENIEHNHTTINQQHKFTTDLSGNSGKLGVGLSSSVSDKLQLYAEAHYLKGHKTKQSLQGILGLRYSF
ncbi:BafA family autotransporter [Bartonella sp. B10]